MNYEELLIIAEEEGIEVLEKDIGRVKGLYVDNIIALNSNLENEIEKVCIISEELGHYYTSYGNILDQSTVENRQQERIARAWAYKLLVSFKNLIKAYHDGARNFYEIADFLNVTESFLIEAINYYKEKYGCYFALNNYIIYFEPLRIVESN